MKEYLPFQWYKGWLACDRWRRSLGLVWKMHCRSYPMFRLSSFLRARRFWPIGWGFSLDFCDFIIDRWVPECEGKYIDKSRSFGHECLYEQHCTLNSASVFLTVTNLCNFFVSIFFIILKKRLQLNLSLNRGLLIYLGSKNTDLEQRWSFPSILHVTMSTNRN